LDYVEARLDDTKHCHQGSFLLGWIFVAVDELMQWMQWQSMLRLAQQYYLHHTKQQYEMPAWLKGFLDCLH
jgi:hypothetical protein